MYLKDFKSFHTFFAKIRRIAIRLIFQSSAEHSSTAKNSMYNCFVKLFKSTVTSQNFSSLSIILLSAYFCIFRREADVRALTMKSADYFFPFVYNEINVSTMSQVSSYLFF